MGAEISKAYHGKAVPEVVVVLSGAFIFAADLLRVLNFSPKIHFIKLASYEGTQSSGEMREELMPLEALRGKPVLVIEDILDTGNTWNYLHQRLLNLGCTEIALAALVVKKSFDVEKLQHFYRGIEIENEFVVGYGLDYNGLGRNLKDIFKLKK